MIAWITRYAMTDGIYAVEAEIIDSAGEMVEYKLKNGWPVHFHGKGRDWHTSRESAVKKAEAMRAAKLKSLQKSMDKLKALDFNEDGQNPRA